MQNQTLLITIIILLLIIILIILCYINFKINNKSTIKRIPKKRDLYNEDLILKKYLKLIKNKSINIDIPIPIDEVGYPLF